MKNSRRPKLLTFLIGCLLLTSFLFEAYSRANAQGGRVKALVGGTLIDGYGSKPIRNSVIIIEGERIKAVGQVGSLGGPSGRGELSPPKA